MIKIMADSTCDLSPQMLEAYDITLVPLHIMVDGGEDYTDGVNITPLQVVNYVENENRLCKTAAVNVFEYQELFDQYASKYDAVIHISLGSQFSSCYQNAKLAATNFSNVYVIDSQNLSTGQGHIVYAAVKMAKQGLSAPEICAQLQELVPKVDASFVIDSLEYLHKGGRCSGLEAFGARLLSIKPCIEVVNGKMIVGKKYRGSFERCLEQYVKERLANNDDIDYSTIFITHSPLSDSERVVEKVREIIQTYANFEEIIVTNAGCTITCHCGPNTLGILYLRKSPKQL